MLRACKPLNNLMSLLSYYCLLACFLILHSSVGRSEATENFKSCATSPTYKYFEHVQYDAYMSNPEFQSLLVALRDKQQILQSLKETGSELDKRDNPLSSPDIASPQTDAYIEKQLRDLKLPTCYENPFTFWILRQYAQRVDAARQDLHLLLPSQVNLATMPTTDINAYTYPAQGDLGSVIAFNTQLFMFDYQMTKVTLPTIAIANEESSHRVAVDHSLRQAIAAIESQPDIRTNFAMAILEFLLLTPPTTQPLVVSYDPLVITFTQGMEMFAVGHEYGHVIRKHTSPVINMRLGADDDRSAAKYTVPVLARSWQQELEADQIGVSLLTEALRKDAKKRPEDELRWVYSLKGALFFFECLDIIDKAKSVRDTGELPHVPTFEERVLLRNFADGKSTAEENAKYKDLTKTTHPPAWLRLERVQAAIDAQLSSDPPSQSSAAFADIGDGILDNVELLWSLASPKLPTLIKAIRLQKANPGQNIDQSSMTQLTSQMAASSTSQEPASAFTPGCHVKPDKWLSSFLCDPTLQDAVVRFERGNQTDDSLIVSYADAIKQDGLLLSGVQLRWADLALTKDVEEDRMAALAIIGLNADRQSVDALARLDSSAWSAQDRDLLTHAKQFIERHGRVTSTAALASTDPTNFKLTDFLCYPSPLDISFLGEKAIPEKETSAIKEFFARNSGITLGFSASPMMLSMAYEHKQAGDVDGLIADLLDQAGSYDMALKYALQGLSSGGSRASLENSIGNILSAQQKLREANEHYSKSLEAGRKDGWPELNTALNLENMNQLNDAEMWFRRALARRSDARSQMEYARYLNEFAWFLVTKRPADVPKVNEALKLSVESNQIVGNRDPNYLDTLAECKAASGDVQGAIVASQEALDLVANGGDEGKKYADRLAYFKSKVH